MQVCGVQVLVSVRMSNLLGVAGRTQCAPRCDNQYLVYVEARIFRLTLGSLCLMMRVLYIVEDMFLIH